ncbi:MAG: hypothetical protein IPH60_00235 [Flavobacteriales bacterium]|nr:hypothetical protein [Flavobacteriales bacterium]
MNTTHSYPLVIDNGSTVPVFALATWHRGIGARAAVQVYLILADRWWWRVRSIPHGAVTDLQGRSTVRNGCVQRHGASTPDVAELTTGSYFLLLDADGTDQAIRFNKQ